MWGGSERRGGPEWPRVPGCVASLDRAALDHRVTLFTCVRLDGCLTHHCLALGVGGAGVDGKLGQMWRRVRCRIHLSLSIDHGAFWMPPPRLRGIVGNRAAAFDALHPPLLFHITPRDWSLFQTRVNRLFCHLCFYSPLRRPCPPPVFLNLIF